MGNSQLNDIPGTRRTVVQLPNITATTAPYDADVETVLLRAVDNITIESVRVNWPLAITGHAANRKDFDFCTRTAVFAGKAVVAEKSFVAGVDAVANTVEEVWAPTGTAGDMTAGMYLTVDVTDEGSGVACGTPSVIIDWRVQE